MLSRRDFHRILIIKPSSFGDVIHALPVLNGLRQRYPQAQISWLVANSCAGLLEGHPSLDEVIRFDRKRYGLLGRNLWASLEFFRFVQQLRERRFDLVVDLQGLFRSGFLAMASGARTRVGFASARELGWMFYSHRIPVSDPEMHAVDRNYLFGRLLGFADVPIRFELPVRADARTVARQLLAEQGWRGGPYVVLGPGTRWETKHWPAEHFAAAVARIVRDSDATAVLTGMPEEAAIARRVVDGSAALLKAQGGQDVHPSRVIDLAGRTSLQQMIALVADSAAVLMNDSGPMHLATALGKPMVAVYGPTSAVRTGPYGRSEAVARLDLPCSPCYLKKLSECPHGHRCLRELQPEVVAEKVLRTLACDR